MDVFDLIEAETRDDGLTVFSGKPGFGGVADTLRGLKATGMSFLDVIQWLPVVLKLVAELGPAITDIVKMIREAIDQGKTPQTFAA